MYRAPWWKRAFIGMIPGAVVSIAHPMYGVRLCINIKKQRLWLGRVRRTEECLVMKALMSHVVDGMVVYDVGAHIGLHALWMARQVGRRGHVVAFEPEPENTRLLRRSLALNGLRNVEVVEAAVCEKTGWARFVLDEHSGATGTIEAFSTDGNSLGNAWFGSPPSVRETPTVSIDAFVCRSGNRPPDVIKIDTEGSETAVIAGAVNTLTSKGPVLAVEFHGAESKGDVWGALKPLGYTCFSVRKDGPMPAEHPWEISSKHGIFVRGHLDARRERKG